MSLSRNTRPVSKSTKHEDVPENQRHYVGRSKPVIDTSYTTELHWYDARQLGYKPKEWPKDERDCDNTRYDMKEKE